MATWQYDIQLIPKSSLLEVYQNIPSYLTFEDYDKKDWWDGKLLPSDFESRIEECLPIWNRSWSPSSKAWGWEQGDRIEIHYSEKKVDEIYIRIDVRNLNETFLELVVCLAVLADCLIWAVESNRLIKPNLYELLQEIHLSSAYKFVTNPEGFLNSIGNKLKSFLN